MSLTQTYRIASTARGKLGREASRGDHNLRLLVGHANLLDSLMIELANAEKEQEAWFNLNVRKEETSPEASKHIHWFDSIVEENEDELSGSEDGEEEEDSDLDSDLDTDEFPMVRSVSSRRTVSPPPPVSPFAIDDDEWEDEDMEDDEEHALERVSSHTPDLIHDSDESDEESMPSSPPQQTLEFNESASDLTDLFQKVPPKLAHQQSVLIDDYMQTSHHSQMVSAF